MTQRKRDAPLRRRDTTERDASGSPTRLVAVTGYGQPEDRSHAIDADFDDHLTKPIVPTDIDRAMIPLEGR